MIEESAESFILEFKPYAAPVEVLPRLEGSPMLECVTGHTVLHLLERTGPYDVVAGPAQVLINPVASKLERAAQEVKTLTPVALSRITATGLVLERHADALIIDTGVPLVVTMFAPFPADIAAGDWLSFESLAPIHGFFVPTRKRSTTRRETEGDII